MMPEFSWCLQMEAVLGDSLLRALGQPMATILFPSPLLEPDMWPCCSGTQTAELPQSPGPCRKYQVFPPPPSPDRKVSLHLEAPWKLFNKAFVYFLPATSNNKILSMI